MLATKKRSEISEERLEPFTSAVGTPFRGGSLYSNGSRCLLSSDDGHMILLDQQTAAQVKSGNWSEGMERHLAARGFTRVDSPSHGCRQPEFFMIDLTNRCNMRCRYCMRDLNTEGSPMSPATLRDICGFIEAYCDRHRIRHVSVQPWGGEPLLELESVLRLREWIAPKETKVHISIETNALLLTAEALGRLREADIALGISIDGPAFCHDRQRVGPDGARTHAIVERNLLAAKEAYGGRVGVIVTVTRATRDHLSEIVDYFADRGLESIKVNYVQKSAFAAGADPLYLRPEEAGDCAEFLVEKMAEMARKGSPLREANILVKLNNLLFRSDTDICLSRGCSAGTGMIAFGRDGGIYPCEVTDYPELKVGDIYEGTDLLDIAKSRVGGGNRFRVGKKSECDGCAWWAFCRGGCMVRKLHSEDPGGSDAMECAVNRRLYPALIRLILDEPETVNRMLGYRGVVV